MPTLPSFDTLLAMYIEPTAIVFLVTAGSAIVFSFIQKSILTKLEIFSKRTKNNIDDAVVAMVQSIRPSFYWYVSLYLGLQTLTLPSFVTTILNTGLLALVLWYALRAGGMAVDMLLKRDEGDAGEKTARHFLGTLAKVVLWSVATLLLLSNLGVNITSLIAGLGVGGIAIAFALQNILTDLFSSFAIYFDKPFVVGDFIVVGDYVGTVERIGIKTTRLRALQGEELVVSNRELTSAHIQNFHSMGERRVEMKFGIAYETPRDTVASLPEKIRATLEPIKNIRIDRVHFFKFGDSSLDFDLIYYVKSGDYNEYMDRQQEMNIALLDLFIQEKVEFAYPTQTIHIASQPKPISRVSKKK